MEVFNDPEERALVRKALKAKKDCAGFKKYAEDPIENVVIVDSGVPVNFEKRVIALERRVSRLEIADKVDAVFIGLLILSNIFTLFLLSQIKV